MKKLLSLILMLLMTLVACNTPSDEAIIELPATDTLQPIPSLTQRLTATIRPTSTDLPTFTPTPTLTLIPPTPSDTPTPTLTPTVVGIVSAVQSINVRSAPQTSASVITALPAGTGVQIIGQNEDGSWYNIRILDDGREGWMASRFIRVENTPTPFPTLTPSPDLTALFLGTPLAPTELIPGRATATPPQQVQTGTAVSERATVPPIQTEGALPGVPTIDNSAIFLTATALAGGVTLPTSAPAVSNVDATEDRSITVVPSNDDNSTPVSVTATNAVAPAPTASGRVIRIFAFCDDPNYGAVTTVPVIRAGDSIQIWWGWFAASEDQVLDHIEASSLDISINGETIPNANSFAGDVISAGGSSFVAYWEIPYGPLAPGEYIITYQVTWDSAIYDGTSFYGPETANLFEQESCTLTVN